MRGFRINIGYSLPHVICVFLLSGVWFPSCFMVAIYVSLEPVCSFYNLSSFFIGTSTVFCTIWLIRRPQPSAISRIKRSTKMDRTPLHSNSELLYCVLFKQ